MDGELIEGMELMEGMESLEGAARKKSLSTLWGSAMNALARREHSEHELRNKLKRKTESAGLSEALIDEVIAALLKDDLLSDERFAYMLCRSRFNKGVGPVRLAHELDQHCIRSEWAEVAMAKYADAWLDHLQELNLRKYGEAPPEDYKAWTKRARFFQQRGFTTSQIQQAIPRW